MKKYILILLLVSTFGNAQYNLFARQNFAKTASSTFNTEIGGVSATLSTAALLATKLGISSTRISNFTVVGSDIKCRISGSYAIPFGCFLADATITYYNDIDGLVTTLSTGENFKNANNLKYVWFPNLTNIQGFNAFPLNAPTQLEYFYIPRVTNLGSTTGNDGVFGIPTRPNWTIYTNPTLATVSAGSPDGDLTDAISRGATIKYVTNFTAPSAITDLSAVTVYNTAVKLTFSTPSSTNALDFYDLYINGTFSKRIVSGDYVTGLTNGTPYTFNVYARDIYYNSSVSNTVTQTTSSYLSDTDASAYTTASSNSAYQYYIQDLYKMLKDYSLYSKIPAFYLNIGTSSQQKYNGKNPLDTDAAYRLTYGGTSTFSDSGFNPNGSTGYANTHLNLSTLSLAGNFTFGYFINTATTVYGDRHGIGAYSSANNWTGIQHNTSTQLLGMAYGTGGTSLAIAAPNIGFFAMSVNGTAKKIYQKDLSSTGTTNGTTVANLDLYLGALNINNSYYSGLNARYGFSFIAEYLDDTEISNLKLIVDIFEHNVGRKTW
jgi:hypothetical protein